MKKNTFQSHNAKGDLQGKSTKKAQLNAVFQAFFEKPRTMKEADEVSGVMRESICRYVRDFRKNERIQRIGEKYCSITKHKAGIYTTNPEHFIKSNQLNLFGNER